MHDDGTTVTSLLEENEPPTGFNTQREWLAEHNSRHVSHGVRLPCIWQSCHFSFKVKSTCDLAPTPNTHTTRMSFSAERQLYLRLSADGLQEGQIEKILCVCVCVCMCDEGRRSTREWPPCRQLPAGGSARCEPQTPASPASCLTSPQPVLFPNHKEQST